MMLFDLHLVATAKGQTEKIDADFEYLNGKYWFSVGVNDGAVVVSSDSSWDATTKTGTIYVKDRNESWTCTFTNGKGTCTSDKGARATSRGSEDAPRVRLARARTPPRRGPPSAALAAGRVAPAHAGNGRGGSAGTPLPPCARAALVGPRRGGFRRSRAIARRAAHAEEACAPQARPARKRAP